MKLYAECIPCQVQVRYKDVEKIIDDENKRVEVMKKVVEYLNEILSKCSSRYDAQCIPTIISTSLFRLVKKATCVYDPYREEKVVANDEALKIYRKLKEAVFQCGNLRERLLKALKISLVGNLIDFGVAGYSAPDLGKAIELIDSMDLYGDVDKSIEILLKSSRIAVIMDNAGEAVLDRVLADVLRTEGKYVIAIVKGAPFQNDITYSEVDQAGLKESFNDVLSTGVDASSIFIDEVDEDFVKMLKSFDVIVSKGMANYEYITEIESKLNLPIIYVLVAKCRPVARDLGVPLGKAVVKVSQYFVR